MIRRGPTFPASLAELNALFAEYDASFSNAWAFDAVSGNYSDLPGSDAAVALSVVGTPTQGVLTGLGPGDRGWQVPDASGSGVGAAAGATFDVTTGSVVMLMTLKFLDEPSGMSGVIGKVNPVGNYWYVRQWIDGSLAFSCWDGTNNPLIGLTANHVSGDFVDMLVIIDRDSASKLTAMTSNLQDGGTASATLLGTLTNSSWVFSAGLIPGTLLSANMLFTFLAIGTVPGTLVSNRVAAVGRWRGYRLGL